MICWPCREGADHLTKFGNTAVAKAYHAECLGDRACDCQHKVEVQAAGKAVQKR
jgi:hypothetical protein